MPRRVRLVPQNPCWPQMFEEEAANLRRLFGDQVVEVYHIGSTAIPDILAKPIVDILVAVRDIESIDEFNVKMTSAGYLAKGEFGIAGRRFFVKGGEVRRSHHIHIFQEGHSEIDRHLDFRDYLIAHPDEAKAYESVKLELAQRYAEDVDSYTEGKNDFVTQANEKARAWKEAL